jgi:carbon-monoxide dehydrogenase iron sulfur subunit
MTRRGIAVREDLCSGCRACQVACVASHEGLFGVYTSRLRVVKDEPLGVDEPQVCRLCGKAPCVAACPSGALYRDHVTSAVLLRSEGCDGCLCCVAACPFGMVSIHPTTGLPLICDLCGGQPVCVERCPTGAIVYGDTGSTAEGPPAMRFVKPIHTRMESGSRALK